MLNSESFPAFGDPDFGFAETDPASQTLGQAAEHNLLAISKIIFGNMDFRRAEILPFRNLANGAI